MAITGDRLVRLPSRDDGRRLYDFLQTSSYTEGGFRQALGDIEPPLPHLRSLPRLLDLTREPTVFNTLARLFLLGVPVEAAAARSVLPEWFVDLALQCRLLIPARDMFEPTTLLVPFGKLLVASDLFQRMVSTEQFDHVLTVNPTAWFLLNATVRNASRSTLDLCAGCGIQALASAPHSEAVVATDLNPRATAFSAFNALLNGFDNIESLTGDLFAPVQGRRFDLIVCNPPFILAPSKRYLYRDNDMELDRFCRALVREAPGYLNEGGFFQMMFEWAQRKGQTWQESIAEWFHGSGCDVWMVETPVQEPSTYAQRRIRETPAQSAEADAATYAEWMTFYRDLGVESIHGGIVTMRLRRGSNWLRTEELAEGDEVQKPFGDLILRGFEGRDFLAAHPSDEQLLEAKLKPAPNLRLEQQYCWLDGWQPAYIRVRQPRGMSRAIGLDQGVAEFLTLFNGQRTARDAMRSVNAKAGVEPAQAQAESIAVLRRMIERGFLLP